MKINVIGLGYIGLPTAAMFAKHGIHVLGIDINEKAVSIINEGKIHIEEPGLGEVVKEVVENGYLRAATKPEIADVHIIAVPTPNNDDEYLSCDLTYVISATKTALEVLKKGDILIIESTIAPRTMDDFVKPLVEAKGFIIGEDVFLAHCPERVLPGQILYELEFNNRIVGGITPICADKAAEVYSTSVKGEIIKTEAKTAEMSKLTENTFRDVNIALADELAKVCNELEINVLDVIKMANKHPRVNIHTPGPGVGGHCLAVDPYFIYAKAPETAKIIKMARDVNRSMPHYVVEKVEKILNLDKNKIISVFGLTYKADVDDLRESPALEIVELLIEKGYNIKKHDPHVKMNDVVSFNDALAHSDLLLILVGHKEFKNIDYNLLEKLMNKVAIFDVTGSISNFTNDQIINYGNLYEKIGD